MQTLRPKVYRYVAFISFRGIDSRYGFVGFLLQALTKRGFRTFLDDREIERGSQITVELSKAIQESKIFIIVISENYGSSAFCLNELLMILQQLTEGNGRSVFPVFYYVNPSDVQNQTGKFGEGFAALHKKNRRRVTPERLAEWVQALRTIVDFSRSGLHLQRACRSGNKYEHECIEEILREISKLEPCSTERDDRVEKVIFRLYSSCVVGICGVSGIGKTTVARGVYRYYAGDEFDCCCFFNNSSADRRLVVLLQQMLLSEIIVGDDRSSNSSTIIENNNVHQGMSMIKQMLNLKKVFFTFEDVDDPEVLNGIVELTSCFGHGSKVIITTARDKCFLELCGIKSIYEVERMNKIEAFQFLNLKIFNSVDVNPYHITILEYFETLASGHPFTLEVIGSYLAGKSIQECERAIHQYEKLPNKETKKILQVSFDALEESQQNMLIQIALNLKQQELAVVENTLLCKNKVCPKNDIRVLLDTSLIKINEHGQVTLHDLTQDMVRDNVLPDQDPPEKISRLRLFEEHGKRVTQPTLGDGSMFWDPMELEGQSSYQCCSSSDPLLQMICDLS